MFSMKEKRQLSDKIQRLIRETNHPELPEAGTEIEFHIRICGRESWSFCDIKNNAAAPSPSINPWNEARR